MGNLVYKNADSQREMMALYDRQASSLGIEYEDIYVDTRFGKTHLLKTGNPDGKPIILFHGGNSTAPCFLRDFIGYRERYLLYAPDTMGHPGKSAQTVLSSKNMEYGQWASDVIDGLGYERMICIGGSYGGGIVAKLMCVAPRKIEKAILIVPSGISNASTAGIVFKMGIPMAMYLVTKKEKWLKKSILPMAVEETEIDEGTLELVRSTFDHVRVKAGMPSNIRAADIQGYAAPTLLIAGEKDVLFPGRKVIARAERLIPNLQTHLMEGGHMGFSSANRHNEMIDLMAGFLEG